MVWKSEEEGFFLNKRLQLSPHRHSILYYASHAWLTPSLGRHEMDDLERIHFRTLHVLVVLVVRDYRQWMNRDLISVKTNRLPPKLWFSFHVHQPWWRCGSPATQWSSRLDTFSNLFVKSRLFLDGSRLRVGRQDLINRLEFMNLNFNWIGDYSDNYIRVKLKEQFFNYWP